MTALRQHYTPGDFRSLLEQQAAIKAAWCSTNRGDFCSLLVTTHEEGLLKSLNLCFISRFLGF